MASMEKGRDQEADETQLQSRKTQSGGAQEEDRGRSPSSPAAASNIVRVCEYCGREFTSGKAYGGHKRIHSQDKIPEDDDSANAELHSPEAAAGMQPKTTKEELMMSKRGSFFAVDDDIGNSFMRNHKEAKCCLCERIFPSLKSLSGHMRSHPEREWRGIQPPQYAKGYSSSSTLSEDERVMMDSHHNSPVLTAGSVNLMESLTAWTTTAKRGRKSQATAAASGNSNADLPKVDDNMEQAVNDLLMLSAAQHPGDKGKAAVETSGGSNSEDSAETQKKKRRLADLDVIRECVCSICNRSFSSYQALGGHMASHNRNKNNNNASRRSSSASDQDNKGGSSGGGGQEQTEETDASGSRLVAAAAPSGGGNYQCNLCNKIFPSGQALGGHKRRHWMVAQAEAPSPSTSAQVSSSAGEVTQAPRKVLDFDLNELPPSD